MTRLLAGRMAFQSTEHKDGARVASRTCRNPDRERLHPGKAAKKAGRKFLRTLRALAAVRASGEHLTAAFDGVSMTTAGLLEATRNLAKALEAAP